MPRRAAPEPDDRGRSQVSWRIDAALVERLRVAAHERTVHPQLLVEAALTEFLDNLIPVEELSWTRRPAPAPAPVTLPPYTINAGLRTGGGGLLPGGTRAGVGYDAAGEPVILHCWACTHAVVFHDEEGCTIEQCTCRLVKPVAVEDGAEEVLPDA